MQKNPAQCSNNNYNNTIWAIWFLSSTGARSKAKSVLKTVFVSFPHKGQHYVIVCYSKIKMFDSTHFHLAHHLAFNLSTNVHAGIGWSSSLGSAFAILAPYLWVQHWAIWGRGSYSVVSIDIAPMFRHVTPQVCWDWCFCWLGWGRISITNILTFGGHTSLWKIITWLFCLIFLVDIYYWCTLAMLLQFLPLTILM